MSNSVKDRYGVGAYSGRVLVEGYRTVRDSSVSINRRKYLVRFHQPNATAERVFVRGSGYLATEYRVFDKAYGRELGMAEELFRKQKTRRRHR